MVTLNNSRLQSANYCRLLFGLYLSYLINQRKNMKTFVALLFFSVSFFQSVKAQEADWQIGDLINQSDWFRLEEEYPKVSGQLQSVAIKALSEVMIGTYFNKPVETIDLIDSLLEHHQEDLGFPNVSSLVALRSKMLGEIGHVCLRQSVISRGWKKD